MQPIHQVEQIENAAIRGLFEYWSSKRVGAALPRRADIDPAEIPRLMRNMLIAEIEHDPFRVRYRLVGTKVVEMTGYEFTGRYLDEIALPDDEAPFLECYRLACESACAVQTRAVWRMTPESTVEYDVCFLPLSDDGEKVNRVISYECYETIERDYDFDLFGRGVLVARKKRQGSGSS